MRRSMLLLALCLAATAFVGSAMATEKPQMMTGLLVSVDAKAMTLVARKEVQGGGPEDIRFDVQPGALVRIHGLKGKLEQLKESDVVTVKYVVKDGKNVATEIQHM